MSAPAPAGLWELDPGSGEAGHGCEAGVRGWGAGQCALWRAKEGTREMQYLCWARPLPGRSRCLPKLGPAQSRTPRRPQAVAAAHAVSSAQPVCPPCPREAHRSPQGHGPLPSSQGSPASLSHLGQEPWPCAGPPQVSVALPRAAQAVHTHPAFGVAIVPQ